MFNMLKKLEPETNITRLRYNEQSMGGHRSVPLSVSLSVSLLVRRLVNRRRSNR